MNECKTMVSYQEHQHGERKLARGEKKILLLLDALLILLERKLWD